MAAFDTSGIYLYRAESPIYDVTHQSRYTDG